MCGIAGIVSLDGRPVSADELSRMSRALTHRGPDGEGRHLDRQVGLAHRRLAIIDPEAGIQPFYSSDGQVVVSYNGEIYNFVELREELRTDFEFKTHSDTEVLVHAYQKWGIGCLERLRGMFAFALLDQRKGSLYLVRDRVGIKPLYYHQRAGRILFASELSAILAVDSFPREIRPESVADYFRYQYVPAPNTIYQDTFKLEPGCYLEVLLAPGRVSKTRYWSLPVGARPQTEAAAREELDALLEDTIRMYVRSDVPFGAFLSGGVDSSLVTALMGRHLAEPVRTFTIGFEEEAHSELPFAKEASTTLGTRHTEKLVSAELAADVLPGLVRHFGEPFGDSSAVPTFYVSREAASEVKMVLSGDGGDELFGGYNSYRATYLAQLARAGRPINEVLELIARRGPPALGRWALEQRIGAHQEQHDRQREAFDPRGLEQFLVPGVPRDSAVRFELDLERFDVDPLTWFQAQDFTTYMVDDVLTKVDRMSMACSLEVRVPLLDHKLVELAFALPTELKLRAARGGEVETKVLLKHSAERFFRPEFLSRPKQGFGIPVVEWCRGPLRALIEHGLRDPRSELFHWVRYEAVQSMLDAFFAGQTQLVSRVWYSLMFDLWFKHVHQATT